MEITEVRIKLMEESEDRLRAFCSITIDHCFVVRDLKIIEGTHGPFVAMPSRKMSARCGRCGNKNHLRSNFCSQCGSRLKGPQDVRDVEGGNPNKLYADIAHPVNQACRDLIQNSVIGEYTLELERAKVPGYRSRYDEEYAEPVGNTANSQQSSGEGGTPSNRHDARPADPKASNPAVNNSGDNSGSVRRPHMLDTPPTHDKKIARDQEGFGDGIF